MFPQPKDPKPLPENYIWLHTAAALYKAPLLPLGVSPLSHQPLYSLHQKATKWVPRVNNPTTNQPFLFSPPLTPLPSSLGILLQTQPFPLPGINSWGVTENKMYQVSQDVMASSRASEKEEEEDIMSFDSNEKDKDDDSSEESTWAFQGDTSEGAPEEDLWADEHNVPTETSRTSEEDFLTLLKEEDGILNCNGKPSRSKHLPLIKIPDVILTYPPGIQGLRKIPDDVFAVLFEIEEFNLNGLVDSCVTKGNRVEFDASSVDKVPALTKALKELGPFLAYLANTPRISIMSAFEHRFFRISLWGIPISNTEKFVSLFLHKNPAFLGKGLLFRVLVKKPLYKGSLGGAATLLYTRIPTCFLKGGEKTIECNGIKVHWGPPKPPAYLRFNCRFCPKNVPIPHSTHLCFQQDEDNPSRRLTLMEKQLSPFSDRTPGPQTDWLEGLDASKLFNEILNDRDQRESFFPIQDFGTFCSKLTEGDATNPKLNAFLHTLAPLPSAGAKRKNKPSANQ